MLFVTLQSVHEILKVFFNRPKRVRFPKGKKVKPEDEVLNAGKDEDVLSELKDPRLAAKERAKLRTQNTTELFSEESRGVFYDISSAEVNYEVCFCAPF